jgi:hypothetical protein
VIVSSVWLGAMEMKRNPDPCFPQDGSDAARCPLGDQLRTGSARVTEDHDLAFARESSMRVDGESAIWGFPRTALLLLIGLHLLLVLEISEFKLDLKVKE